MSDLFDKLNQLGKQAARNQASASSPRANNANSGDLGDVLGDLLGGLFGGSPVQQQQASNLSNTGKAALFGGTAGLAAMAYKMFQKWQAGAQESSNYRTSSQSQWGNQNTYQYQNTGRIGSDPFSEYNQTQATQRASMEQRNEMGRLILRAMIYAARADGHIDAKEQAMIMSATQQLSYEANINSLIREYLSEPLNPQTLARCVRTKDQALDVYRLSSAAIVADHPQEQQYLADLARVLNIDTTTKRQLDQEASTIRRQVSR